MKWYQTVADCQQKDLEMAKNTQKEANYRRGDKKETNEVMHNAKISEGGSQASFFLGKMR